MQALAFKEQHPKSMIKIKTNSSFGAPTKTHLNRIRGINTGEGREGSTDGDTEGLSAQKQVQLGTPQLQADESVRCNKQRANK